MSAKAKELFEKAKAQRDKDNDRLVNYAITLGNIKDKTATSLPCYTGRAAAEQLAAAV